ncbi:unnamed protein product [Dracunculus medinensis]|uniref:Uncharacterized protein n=1 Tax=Dracunculus medinensis TaxID=318479 RepID=A0A0N4UH51_DRAME|nr:unnamed protein product [Dracunculus medinensis]
MDENERVETNRISNSPTRSSAERFSSNLPGRLFAMVQHAGSDNLSNEIVEDFRNAIDILTRVAPVNQQQINTNS